MPTYEYGCRGCGHQWELVQRITEDAIKKCPVCRKARAQRLISGANFILKGGGWYADLYSSKRPSASKGDETKSDETKSSDAKSSDAESSAAKSSDAKSSDSSKPAEPAKSASRSESKSARKKAANE